MMSPLPKRSFRIAAFGAGLALATLPAHALVRWNEGKDRVFVSATVTMVADSNIYTSADKQGDLIYSLALGADYERRAGMIGVNASLGVTRSEFGSNKDQGFTNPNMRLEFEKDVGRTTGTLGFNAMRSKRADPTVNVRTDSWNYGSDLSFKYPVSDRNSLSGGLNWHRIDYLDNTLFVDLDSYSLSADWFYVYSTQRDILAGYRLRINETSADTTFADHSFSGGVSGRILPGLNGTARLGYQIRQGIKGTSERFEGFNGSLSATWNFTRKISLTGQVAKDFSITSRNVSTDSLSGTLDLQYARSAKMTVGGGVGGGINTFLGEEGEGRKDTFFSAYGRISYTFSERLKLGILYSYYKNWSTAAYSDFDRETLTIDASTRF